MPTEWIPTSEAADMLGFGPNGGNRVSQLAREGRVKAKRIGVYWLVTKASVEKYMWSRGVGRPVGAKTSARTPCSHAVVYMSGDRAGRCTRCGHFNLSALRTDA